MTEFAAIPEHLPGEPPPKTWSSLGLALAFAGRLALLGLTTLVALPLWPLYLALRLLRRRPPHLPPLNRRLRYLHLLRTRQLTPGLTERARLALTLALLQDLMLVPLKGLAWYADELLYGSELRGVQIRQPLIELSAARTGSSQLARYLEQDPQLCRPLMIQQTFRNLAERSKRATGQVRAILGDIQQATSLAVMVTDEGTKNVDVGTQLAGQAGNAIR